LLTLTLQGWCPMFLCHCCMPFSLCQCKIPPTRHSVQRSGFGAHVALPAANASPPRPHSAHSAGVCGEPPTADAPPVVCVAPVAHVAPASTTWGISRISRVSRGALPCTRAPVTFGQIRAEVVLQIRPESLPLPRLAFSLWQICHKVSCKSVPRPPSSARPCRMPCHYQLRANLR